MLLTCKSECESSSRSRPCSPAVLYFACAIADAPAAALHSITVLLMHRPLRAAPPTPHPQAHNGQNSYPHQTDDVWTDSIYVCHDEQLREAEVYERLAPVVQADLEDVWPSHLMPESAKRPCVRAGAQVPSLAVFSGTVTGFDHDTGMAELTLACGTLLPHVKVM